MIDSPTMQGEERFYLHYNFPFVIPVLKESLNADAPGAALDATGIQKLAYKLTHMYYNWPGTVRVPAPVQYAHKLVDLVGQHVHRPPSNNLANRLYYL